MSGVLWLGGVIIVFWLVVAVPASYLGGPPKELTALTALLNFVPGLLFLLVVRLARLTTPIMQLALFLSGGFIRLVFAVGVGGLIYYLDPDLRGSELALLSWGSVFYLVALATETVLVYRRELSSGENGLV